MKSGDTIYLADINLVIHTAAELVFLRDSSIAQNSPLGANEMVFTDNEWKRFVKAIKNGELDLEDK